MKASRLFLMICTAALLFGACKKQDYTCKCKVGMTGGDATMTINHTTEKSAKEQCSSYEHAPVDGYSNCHLE